MAYRMQALQRLHYPAVKRGAAVTHADTVAYAGVSIPLTADMTPDGWVNGQKIPLLVDTGSSHSVLRDTPDATPIIPTQHGKLDTPANIYKSPGYLGRQFLNYYQARFDLPNQLLKLNPDTGNNAEASKYEPGKEPENYSEGQPTDPETTA